MTEWEDFPNAAYLAEARQFTVRIETDGSVKVVSEGGNSAALEYGDFLARAIKVARTQERWRCENEVAENLCWQAVAADHTYPTVLSAVYVAAPSTGALPGDRVPDAIRAHWPNVAKVGFTGGYIHSRHSSLMSYFGCRLDMLAYAQTPLPDSAECGVHRLLSPFRLAGEWFRLRETWDRLVPAKPSA